MTTQFKIAGMDRWDTALTIFYVFFLAIMLPEIVSARSDDFAYLQVAAQTVRDHWPATSNWFEANNIFLSVTTAAAYVLTKNFYFATYGVLVLFSTGSLVLLNLLIKQSLPAGAITRYGLLLTIVLFPDYLNKSLDYVGVAPAIFFFLLGIFFYCRHNYWGLFLASAAGFLVRENELMLLALPASDILHALAADRKKAAHLALRLSAGFALVLALSFAVKYNFHAGWIGSRYINRPLAALSFRDIPFRICIGLSIALTSLVVFRVLTGSAPDESLLHTVKRNAWSMGFLLVLAIAMLMIGGQSAILLEPPIPSYAGFSAVSGYALAILDFAALLLALRTRSVVPWASPFFLAQCVDIMAISARGGWWDYYFLEIVLLSLVQALHEVPSTAGHPALSVRRQLAMGALLCFGAVYAVYFGRQLKISADLIEIYEPLVRSGAIYQQEASDTPWGYDAWYTFERWIKIHPDAAGASSIVHAYTDANVRVLWSRAPGPSEPGCSLLAKGRIPGKWINPYYGVVRCGARLPGNAKLVSPRLWFPLNRKEWDSYISAARETPIRGSA